MRFFFNAFFSKCEQIPAHLVIFTNEISNKRLRFLCNKYLTTESISNYHKQKLITDSSTKFYYCTYVSIRSSPPVLRKRCSENMQQIYRGTPMSKCDFSKVEITFRHECSPVCSHVNLLHIFRTTFPENSPGGLLLPECFGEGSEKAPGERNH